MDDRFSLSKPFSLISGMTSLVMSVSSSFGKGGVSVGWRVGSDVRVWDSNSRRDTDENDASGEIVCEFETLVFADDIEIGLSENVFVTVLLPLRLSPLLKLVRIFLEEKTILGFRPSSAERTTESE